MQPSRVTLVEDDPTVLAVVGDYLRRAGFEVEQFSDGISARAGIRRRPPDVLVVDRMLPGISGDELCREIRAESELPIMMLTALASVEERIDGLEHGADDYLAKPFALRELQLRLEALLRRRPASPSTPETVGPFRVDRIRRRVEAWGREIVLTGREHELFLFLVRNEGRVVSREELLREVWGWGFGDASTVTTHVRRLREKIEPDPGEPRYLRTEWGAGYRFTVEDASC